MEEGRRTSALAAAAKDKSERRENFMVLEKGNETPSLEQYSETTCSDL